MTRLPRNISILLTTSLLALAACAGADSVPTQLAAANPTATATPRAATDHNVVTDWAAIVAPTIHSAAEPRRPAAAAPRAAIVALAVYDAAVAVEGGYEPYATTVDAPEGADLDAAVATAAYRAARGRAAPSQYSYLDAKHSSYLATIADGQAKTDGVGVGEAAAAGVLAKRANSPRALPAGDLDFALGYAATHLLRIDSGDPTVMLGGIHVGCWQVFASRGIRAMSELKGKRVGVVSPTGPDGIFLAITLGNVGIRLSKDVEVVTYTAPEAADLLASGRVDALAAFPPYSQALRDQGIGTVMVNSMVDRPWSNYFCCMATVNRSWMERHPVATRRALRAVLRAADVVDAHPGHAARLMVDRGHTDNLTYARQNLREIPYDVWRRLDPADTVRYLALRMKEAGLVKGTPEQLLERGTDFSHLAELARELVSTPSAVAGPQHQH
ncbi:MAG: ABC transporter substrate-binding protein [Sporichthyaceae bacterium]